MTNYLFVLESAPEVRTHHLHIVESDSAQLREYILFKEVLLQDAVVRSEYAALKSSLSKRFANDRRAYTAAKDNFIKAALARN